MSGFRLISSCTNTLAKPEIAMLGLYIQDALGINGVLGVSVAYSPDQIMPLSRAEPMLEVEVDRGTLLVNGILQYELGMIHIALQAGFRAISQQPFVAGQNIFTFIGLFDIGWGKALR